jgi:tetratricopeptide (TPR) repeat protein
MRENPYREDREELKELLRQYQNLKTAEPTLSLKKMLLSALSTILTKKMTFRKRLRPLRRFVAVSLFFPINDQKGRPVTGHPQVYRDALDMLEVAELYDSSDLNLYILKTDAYLALDQQAKAIELLETALSLFEGEEKIDLLFELADVYDDYEEFDKVFDCLKLVLEAEPNNEEALYKICFWTDFTGRNEESIRLHQQIIEEFPLVNWPGSTWPPPTRD